VRSRRWGRRRSWLRELGGGTAWSRRRHDRIATFLVESDRHRAGVGCLSASVVVSEFMRKMTLPFSVETNSPARGGGVGSDRRDVFPICYRRRVTCDGLRQERPDGFGGLAGMPLLESVAQLPPEAGNQLQCCRQLYDLMSFRTHSLA